MTRVSLAASTTSAVMAESSLMLMIRATWPIRRSMRRKLPPVMRVIARAASSMAVETGLNSRPSSDQYRARTGMTSLPSSGRYWCRSRASAPARRPSGRRAGSPCQIIPAYVQQSGHPGRKGGSDVTGRQVQGSQPV
jgi:hypothetical protein